MKILGVHFRSDMSAYNVEGNWTSKLDNIRRTIKQWTRRNLSIYGKILISKTFLLSQLIHIMQSVGIPEDVLTKINREIYYFLWKKKYNNKKAFEKVKRKVMTQDYGNGGLGVIDLKTLQNALFLTWIPKLMNNNCKGIWKTYPSLILSKMGKVFNTLSTPTSQEDIDRTLAQNSPFWSCVIQTWSTINNKVNQADNMVFLNSSLWLNQGIRYKGKSLHMKEWMAKGIYTISDILHQGQLLSFR